MYLLDSPSMALLEKWLLSGAVGVGYFFVVNFGFILTFLTTNLLSAAINFPLRPKRGNVAVVNKALYDCLHRCTWYV